MLTEAMVERGAAAIYECHAAFLRGRLRAPVQKFDELDEQTRNYYRTRARACLEAALTNEEGVFEA